LGPLAGGLPQPFFEFHGDKKAWQKQIVIRRDNPLTDRDFSQPGDLPPKN
jgi:hypothetical protein